MLIENLLKIGMTGKSVETVIKRFPDKKNRILIKYQQSDEFKEVCSDYKEIIEARSKKVQPGILINDEEYKILLEELENEILSFLENKN